MAVHQRAIIEATIRNNVPAVGADFPGFVKNGGLLSYGANFPNIYIATRPGNAQVLFFENPIGASLFNISRRDRETLRYCFSKSRRGRETLRYCFLKIQWVSLFLNGFSYAQRAGNAQQAIACARGARTDKEIRNLRAGVRPIDSLGALAIGALSIRPHSCRAAGAAAVAPTAIGNRRSETAKKKWPSSAGAAVPRQGIKRSKI
jgi:hypothetical protein